MSNINNNSWSPSKQKTKNSHQKNTKNQQPYRNRAIYAPVTPPQTQLETKPQKQTKSINLTTSDNRPPLTRQASDVSNFTYQTNHTVNSLAEDEASKANEALVITHRMLNKTRNIAFQTEVALQNEHARANYNQIAAEHNANALIATQGAVDFFKDQVLTKEQEIAQKEQEKLEAEKIKDNALLKANITKIELDQTVQIKQEMENFIMPIMNYASEENQKLEEENKKLKEENQKLKDTISMLRKKSLIEVTTNYKDALIGTRPSNDTTFENINEDKELQEAKKQSLEEFKKEQRQKEAPEPQTPKETLKKVQKKARQKAQKEAQKEEDAILQKAIEQSKAEAEAEAEAKKIKKIKKLFTKDNDGNTPLHEYISKEGTEQTEHNKKILKELSELSPKQVLELFKIQNNYGETILHTAFLAENSIIIPELLKLLKNLSSQDKLELYKIQGNFNKETILTFAIIDKNKKIIRLLLNDLTSAQKLELLSLQNKKGYTHLHIAYNNYPDILPILINGLTGDEQEKLYAIPNNDGINCSQLYDKIIPEVLNNMSPEEKMDMLRIRHTDGKTMLHTAVIDKKKDYINIYLKDLTHEQKKEIYLLKDSNGYTALYYALQLDDNHEIAHLLISKYDIAPNATPIDMN